jgi:hypothetical protein
MVSGSSSLYATELTTLITLKGPIYLGSNFLLPGCSQLPMKQSVGPVTQNLGESPRVPSTTAFNASTAPLATRSKP